MLELLAHVYHTAGAIVDLHRAAHNHAGEQPLDERAHQCGRAPLSDRRGRRKQLL